MYRAPDFPKRRGPKILDLKIPRTQVPRHHIGLNM